jgi:DNA-binding transcriptional ArsR family regulator
MDRDVRQLSIRAVMALCRYAERTDDRDFQGDIADECAILLDVATATSDSQPAMIQSWCVRMQNMLRRLSPNTSDGESFARAELAVLRLRSAVVVSPKALVRPSEPLRVKKISSGNFSRPSSAKRSGNGVGENQKKVLSWLREHPGARPKDLIAHFVGSLSDRTIKRSLKDLTGAGLLRRIERDDSVVYEVAE